MSSSVSAIFVARSRHRKQTRKGEREREAENTKMDILRKFCYENLFHEIY